MNDSVLAEGIKFDTKFDTFRVLRMPHVWTNLLANLAIRSR